MIATIVFVSGAIVMSFEILGSRVLAPHFGNDVFVWGSLIGVFLAGLSLGYWGGGRLADWPAGLSNPAHVHADPDQPSGGRGHRGYYSDPAMVC